MKRHLLAALLGLSLLAACAPPGGQEADEPDPTPTPAPTESADDETGPYDY